MVLKHVIWTAAAGVAVLGAGLEAGAVTNRFEDLPREPTYESACANWPPLTGQCVVLSAMDSRAKFISTLGGGVHTVYVSEVLGHCPLLPSPAQLLPLLPQGVQVLVGTGATPDFRLNARESVRQRLVDGYLPMVTTTWHDESGPLSYEQLSFVRLIGRGMEVGKGDENSAAFVRVRVHNASDAEQHADLWLSICGSSNGQGRSVATFEYRAPLHLGKDRVVNDRGELRVLWKGPADAQVDYRIRDKVPVPEGHGDYAAKPFSGHEPEKAFDNLFATFWAPTTEQLSGTAGVGLRFPEATWVRGVTMGSLGAMVPAPGGYDLQYFDGGDWRSIRAVINGKTADEVENDPELASRFGDIWGFNFDPVKAEAVRLMITKMPADKAYPAVNWMNLSYSPDYDPAANTGRWVDTGAGDPLSNYAHFRFPVPAGGHRDLVVLVPFAPASKSETAWIEKRDFEAEARTVRKYWRSILDKGGRLDVPEDRVREVWNANIAHILTNAEVDPTIGLPVIKANVGWYDAVWGNLAAAEIIGLDMQGYHDIAERYLETFLEWQGHCTPPGNFESREGFLSSPDDYTWVRWTSNHGWLLWALSEHYLLSGDRQWLDRVMDKFLAACDWVERERSRTKVNAADGSRPPEWGILPAGVTGDGAPPCYQFATDGFTWAGLNAAAQVLREVGHPRAAEFTGAVDEYRKCILRAVRWASENSGMYKLKSGEDIRFVPLDLYNTWKITNENKHPWWLDVGPLHLVDCGVVDARSDLADLMIRLAEDYWLVHTLALYEPWYAPQRMVYYGRDQISRFLEVYYNELAEGMDRQTYAHVEGHGGVQNLPWADGEHTKFLRMMLVRESFGTLELCPACPRAWLAQGKRIAVDRLPTHFGSVSYSIRSDVDNNRITARVTPPNRRPAPVKLRIRHPEAEPIKAVRINGKAAASFAGEWISLPAGTAAVEVEIAY